MHIKLLLAHAIIRLNGVADATRTTRVRIRTTSRSLLQKTHPARIPRSAINISARAHQTQPSLTLRLPRVYPYASFIKTPTPRTDVYTCIYFFFNLSISDKIIQYPAARASFCTCEKSKVSIQYPRKTSPNKSCSLFSATKKRILLSMFDASVKELGTIQIEAR
uniref:Uncharacterized protein n=1 Tax=Trichogramma kaykai TaxID=54128 RepID=A0ABD2VV99_9HYME